MVCNDVLEVCNACYRSVSLLSFSPNFAYLIFIALLLELSPQFYYGRPSLGLPLSSQTTVFNSLAHSSFPLETPLTGK